MLPKRSPKATCLLRPLRNQRGQSLAELGMVVGMFVVLLIGTLEVGRTFLIGNMITQAVREGARAAALTADRQTSTTMLGLLNTTAVNAVKDVVRNEILGVLDANTVNNVLQYEVSQVPSTGGIVATETIPTVTVRVHGNVNYIFGLLGTSFAIDRSVSFRDEGR